eukprot:gene19093-31408_t
MPMDLRAGPAIDGPLTEHRLNDGDVFEVSERWRGDDGVTYLHLSDGQPWTGWAFEEKPGVGTMCERVHA